MINCLLLLKVYCVPTLYLHWLRGSGLNPWNTSHLMVHSMCVASCILLNSLSPIVAVKKSVSGRLCNLPNVTQVSQWMPEPRSTYSLLNLKAHVPSTASHRLYESLKTGETLRLWVTKPFIYLLSGVHMMESCPRSEAGRDGARQVDSCPVNWMSRWTVAKKGVNISGARDSNGIEPFHLKKLHRERFG